METEKAVIKDCREGKVRENLNDTCPDSRVTVFAMDLIIEAISARERSSLVISAK